MIKKNPEWVRSFCRFAILYMLIFICAGNITNSFLLKWGFRDSQKDDFSHSYSLVGMMNGDAPKPFVYRSQLAKGAKWCAEQFSPATREKLYRSISRYDSLRKSYFDGVPASYWTPVVAIAYHLMYAAVVFSALFSLLLIYGLARMHGLGFGAAIGFMAAFSFVYPLTFQQGGYYYDFVELLGVFGAVYFFLRRRLALSTLFVSVFSLNKETFFLVPIALFFLHGSGVPLIRRFAWCTLQVGVCLVARLYIMAGYESNSGGFVEFHLLDNLAFWLNPGSYFLFYNLVGKGVFTPSLQSPFMLVPLVLFFRVAWKATPAHYRRYFYAAFLPVFGLFVLFGYKDEARNFSVVFPAIVLIALHGASQFGRIFERGAQQPDQEFQVDNSNVER